MGLADARRAEQQERVAVGDPAAGGELADPVRIEARLRGEVEAVELARATSRSSAAIRSSEPASAFSIQIRIRLRDRSWRRPSA
jgi:hypothetical protein